jgi:hypothetical protein
MKDTAQLLSEEMEILAKEAAGLVDERQQIHERANFIEQRLIEITGAMKAIDKLLKSLKEETVKQPS